MEYNEKIMQERMQHLQNEKENLEFKVNHAAVTI